MRSPVKNMPSSKSVSHTDLNKIKEITTAIGKDMNEADIKWFNPKEMNNKSSLSQPSSNQANSNNTAINMAQVEWFSNQSDLPQSTSNNSNFNNEAKLEYEKLDVYMRSGIAKGLTKAEILELSKYYKGDLKYDREISLQRKIDTLAKYGNKDKYPEGYLTAEDFNSFDDKNDFTINHKEAIKFLIAKGNTPLKALQELLGFTGRQAYGFIKGLTRTEILELSKYPCEHEIFGVKSFLEHKIDTLAKYGNKDNYPEGYLTAADFNSFDDNNPFSYNYKKAMKALIAKGYTPLKALQELIGITQEQAYGFIKGLAKAEILELSKNGSEVFLEHKIDTLVKYGNKNNYPEGYLVAANFNSFDDKNDFTSSHKEAMEALIAKGYTPLKALQELIGITREQVYGFIKGLAKSEILELNSNMQLFDSRVFLKYKIDILVKYGNKNNYPEGYLVAADFNTFNNKAQSIYSQIRGSLETLIGKNCTPKQALKKLVDG